MRPSLVARSPFFAADSEALTQPFGGLLGVAVGLDQGLLAVHHAGACVFVLCFCVSRRRRRGGVHGWRAARVRSGPRDQFEGAVFMHFCTGATGGLPQRTDVLGSDGCRLQHRRWPLRGRSRKPLHVAARQTRVLVSDGMLLAVGLQHV